MKNNESDSQNKPPASLRLAFAKASDYQRVNEVFNNPQKHEIDPHGYVAKRREDYFKKALHDGSAAFLTDENGKIVTLTIAYRIAAAKTDTANDNQCITEVGTSLAYLPHYHSVRLVIAALVLREWLDLHPENAIVAEINNENAASIKAYNVALGWEKITDPDDNAWLFETTDKTIARDENKFAANPEKTLREGAWYQCTDSTVAMMARTLLNFMTRGGLTHSKTGHFIPVDFSALEETGLNRLTLQQLAAGPS